MKDLYSIRHRDNNGEPDVFVYDDFSDAFRNQVFYIIKVFIILVARNQLPSHNVTPDDFATKISIAYCYEKGLKHLYRYLRRDYDDLYGIEHYIEECNDADLLDFMDFVFANYVCSDELKRSCNGDNSFFDDSINELNRMLKRHNLGYEFCNGEIIKKTNTVAHETIIKPALQLLLDENFRGAEEEYLLAFDCYKEGNNKDAIANALKSFESVMKTICNKLGYSYTEKDGASRLIAILKSNSFFPLYLETQLNSVKSILESGIPTMRNKEAGHGQGEEIVNVSDEFVEFALNSAATNIILLFRIYQEKI